MVHYGNQEEFRVLRKRKINSAVIYKKAGEEIYSKNFGIGSALKKDSFGLCYIETAMGTQNVPSGTMVKFTPSSYTPSGYEAEPVESKEFLNVEGLYYPKAEIKKAAWVMPNSLPSFLQGRENDYRIYQEDEGYRIKNAWGEKLVTYGSVWIELNTDPDILGVDVIRKNAFKCWLAIDEKGYHLALSDILMYEPRKQIN